ncbi:hypothetical protein EIP91_000575 [Steccherinum ochraceum]|uniref:CN hydrolase domain-containing protein n=1 Tax=Steccherinum ochraceum TaxID=92696 RepID=A0A4R0RJ20_9APHY|nr:hypothetical protein EIP91_000575 [Steccherinum ochraceum]
MTQDVRSLIVAHPSRVFLSVCPLLAFFSLSTTPGFIPIVALITSLRLWSWISIPRANHTASKVSQVLLVAVAAGATQLAPSTQALSTPTTSLVILSLFSVFSSSIAFAAFFIAYSASRAANTPWTRLAMFPAIWATTWGSISRVSPLGHLANWSPVLGLEAYNWSREVFGQWGIDWITAAWAVVLSEVIGDWLVAVDQQELDSEAQEVLVDVQDANHPSQGVIGGQERKAMTRSRGLWSLLAILIALALPSYIISSYPMRPQSPETTSFTVGCALPASRPNGKISGEPTLQDYIVETRTIQAYAPIVLWPEGAVRFNSLEEKQNAFQAIQDMPLGRGRFVGVSFEDYTPASTEDGIYHPAMRRNGFALLGHTGAPVMEYYKRNLVPVAESFSLTPGTEEPPIYNYELTAPKRYKKPDWAPAPNFTRPIPVTASICFDFASSSSFALLESRPAIIFAPAKTWHLDIGYAMWEQAKARAMETGSVVVWCDGGAGGVSGVAARGLQEIVQVGQGSWTRTIGLQWPFDERRTVFNWGGSYMALISVWGILGVGWVVEGVAYRRAFLFGPVMGLLARFSRRRTDEERPLLHD